MRTNKTSNFMAIHLIVAEIFQSRSKSWTDFSYGLERGELMLRQLLFGIEIYVEDLLWQLFLLPLRRTLQLCINIKTQKDNIYERYRYKCSHCSSVFSVFSIIQIFLYS